MKYADAKNALDKLTSFIGTLEKARTVLDAACSLEQDEAALQYRLKQTREALEKSEAALAESGTDLEAAMASVAAADKQAAQIVADAGTKASEIVSAAKADAKVIENDAAQAKFLSDESVSAAKREVTSLAEQAQTLRGELADINGRIEQAKADARQRFGG